MRIPTMTEALVQERQQALREAAARYRPSRPQRSRRRTPLRTGAGLILVRAGLRLARTDSALPDPELAPVRL